MSSTIPSPSLSPTNKNNFTFLRLPFSLVKFSTSEENQKEVDKVLAQRFLDANKEKKNVIVDMTHMASKRRKQNLNYFTDDYYKLGVIFPILSDDEYVKRNKKRIEEENKDLPMGIVKSMISSYQPITSDEGFNKVISL